MNDDEIVLDLGLDVGSTTVKVAVLNPERSNDGLDKQMIYSSYRRHHADIRGSILEILQDAASGLGQKYKAEVASKIKVRAALTGSAGLGVAKAAGIEFVQEVIAETKAIKEYNPEADVIIELGGEDAKITYLHPTPEQRMNGSCAGGTGSFIDQMATLLKTDAAGLNKLASNYNNLYPIASRCGVFAKTDLQPLINDGAPSEDLAASIFQAVATQTIAGLACGRPIRGNVVFLGGPLYFMPELRQAFVRSLGEQVDSFDTPQNAQLYVAIGSALLARDILAKDKKELPTLEKLIQKLKDYQIQASDTVRMRALFEDDEEFAEFSKRHENDGAVSRKAIEQAEGAVFLGIDAGSTTIKAVLLDSDDNMLYDYYASNEGDPVGRAVEIIKDIRTKLPRTAIIANSCITGYGEGLIKAALHVDEGEVETVAHYTAAEHISPGVTSIIDIGGQDMKYLTVGRTDDGQGVIESIAVNEACSSGCGSFLQTFSAAMGQSIQDFAAAALESKSPVDLGSRCTVFMNSSVKQAQKEGATLADISAGLSYSVVRNALYKVIKLRDPKQLGTNVVVQGGTFLNNAVLRAFELLTNQEVTRPTISGLMGAYGAALIAQKRFKPGAPSSLLGLLELDKITIETEQTKCPLCPNHCSLTISHFNDGSYYVTGNRCERGGNPEIKKSELPNLYDYKYHRTFDYKRLTEKRAEEQDKPYRGVIGIPRVLNQYENFPFWMTVLSELGFEVKLSGRSDHKLFEKGMDSIASENICYPAKMVHGHIVDLLEKGINRIFYPCITFEQAETKDSDNNYNCPIVCNYPQVIANNVEQLSGARQANNMRESEIRNTGIAKTSA
ncbi:MAG: acyl-CoA dehydratase activase-related protein, partial [Candidatus Ancillula sp.]|nr:acyl-CoA dehydratase activase-related protein [Candidatus Ancillula sp.]